MKLINKILTIIVIIGSIISCCNNIIQNNFYRILIDLSAIIIILIPLILKKLFKIKISLILETSYIIFAFCAQFLGSIINLYDKIYFYDTLIHFLSGFMSAIVAHQLIIKIKSKKILFNALFIIGFSCLIACSWEIFEFVSDNIFNKDAQRVLTTGVNDTMKDIIVAYLASILYSLVYIYEKKKYNEGIINKIESSR